MKVIVCGAGIAGLALTSRLATLGHEVVVLERSPGPRRQGYMMDFFGPGYDAADAMGVLPAIREAAYPIEEATLVDQRGRRRAGLPYHQVRDAVGGRLCSLMRPDLERVLRDSLPDSVDLRFGAALTGIDDDGDRVTATLHDGTRLEAELLVGADGIHSTVRRLVFGGESEFLRYLGFHSAAFVFDAPGIRDACAGRFVLTDTVGRQMGFYALRDGAVAAFAVHRTDDPALPDDIRGSIAEEYRGLGWVVPQALELCPPSDEIYYDQVAQIEMPRWSSGRVTLLGDACYAVSLLAGQGASLAIAGAYVLASHLHDAPSIPEALAGYERQWRPMVLEKQESGRAAARWFLPESALALQVRRTVLRFADLPVVNRFIGRLIAGKTTALTAAAAAGDDRARRRLTPIVRAAFRAPIWLYDHGLGWLLGRRFVCLTHTGRRSGRRYRTVLEVVGHRGSEYFVVAGFGRKADWYRNVTADPDVRFAVGRHDFTGHVRLPDDDEAAAIIADYEHRNRWVTPVVRAALSWLLGWRYDGSPEARARMVDELPVVALSAA
ncbi:nitroreductase family deazaflavin-dependent oxidoreductase [Mycobacterium sp. Y57]|uniref:nitroreductase family deazaflavin-dependent oxidoreductase n=1 Tax=Mycolicibacterium xanthum TaxID=2796469 RepID=UPI001C847455|nr:nitroreductase family deazaflavin-dependent oxidoreductase [Mycolicibacterium xanthum]MBX7435192.1 nitroreductase family deazaflavin-dependent oxidoreductase [Mycolicibacterium xanthum]